MQTVCQVPGPHTFCARSVGCIVHPQRKVQVHKGLVIFGPTVSNSIPRPNVSGRSSAGVRWSWLDLAVQIRASQSTGVSPGLAPYLSSRSLNSRVVNRQVVVVEGGGFCAPEGALCCSVLITGAKRAGGREPSSLSPCPEGRVYRSACFQISPSQSSSYKAQ